MRSKVLIVTRSDEPNIESVTRHLQGQSVDFVRINTDEFLQAVEVSWDITQDCCNWELIVGGRKIGFHEVCSVWYRQPASPQAPARISPEHHRKFVEEETRRFLWALWSASKNEEILWVNQPITLRLLEGNKPYQLLVASRLGLKIPETVITNDPAIVQQRFERFGGEMVFKAFEGSKIEGAEGKLLTIYTNRVTAEYLRKYGEEIKVAPVMFQKYTPKDFELRVTIVGEKVFACAIHSQDSPKTKDDWRHYDFEKVRHEPYTLPQDVAERLMAFMRTLGLSFGAIDMIVTPAGEHVFLEINPSGQWGWIEQLTGMPISKAIAELLANPPKP